MPRAAGSMATWAKPKRMSYGPMVPISTYGASKLAGEALISSYCHMFGLTGCSFRFGNVVGSRQTHGVGFDSIRRLTVDPGRLPILGDGTQSKSYIHVSDVVDAVLYANRHCFKPYETFNVATGDYITVTEIAELAIECLGINPPPKLEYSGVTAVGKARTNCTTQYGPYSSPWLELPSQQP